jgi:hypothetical protein
MSYFGDQESQIVAPFWDPPNDVPPSPTSYHDPCSAPQMGNDNQGRPGSDDTIEDHHGPEVEQDSCISRVGETQFVGLEQDSCASRETQSVNLEPETQALDDLVSDSPTIDRLLYHADTSTSTEVRKNDTPLTFTRPKDIGQEDVHGGFRFSRAEKPKPGQFSRPVAKASDVHANSKPTEAFTSLPIPLPESTSEYLRPHYLTVIIILDIVQLDQLGSRPSLNVRQDRNSTEESEAELPRSTITSMGQNAAPVPPVKDLQVDAGRPERIIQQAAMTPVKFSSPRPAQRVVSSNKLVTESQQCLLASLLT